MLCPYLSKNRYCLILLSNDRYEGVEPDLDHDSIGNGFVTIRIQNLSKDFVNAHILELVVHCADTGCVRKNGLDWRTIAEIKAALQNVTQG